MRLNGERNDLAPNASPLFSFNQDFVASRMDVDIEAEQRLPGAWRRRECRNRATKRSNAYRFDGCGRGDREHDHVPRLLSSRCDCHLERLSCLQRTDRRRSRRQQNDAEQRESRSHTFILARPYLRRA